MSSIVLSVYSDPTRSTFIAGSANSKWSIRPIRLGFIGLRKENEIKETKICPQGNSKRLGLRMIHAMVGCTTSVNPFVGKKGGKMGRDWGSRRKVCAIVRFFQEAI